MMVSQLSNLDEQLPEYTDDLQANLIIKRVYQIKDWEARIPLYNPDNVRYLR